jgi:hypothetical protein
VGGGQVPPEYVDKLYAMVARHNTPLFRVVCMTDQPEAIRPEIECLPSPTVSVPPPHNNRGWRKVSRWNDSLPGMEGDWLYLDLDVVVTGTLDGFFDYEPELLIRPTNRLISDGFLMIMPAWKKTMPEGSVQPSNTKDAGRLSGHTNEAGRGRRLLPRLG